MRNTLHQIVAIVAALVIVSAAALAGGGNRVGTAGADQLLIPVGARGIALGSSYMAGISGTEAIYFNPAGLSASTARAEAMFSNLSHIGDVDVQYLAIASNFSGFGHLALTVKSLSMGDLAVTDERNPDGTGATFSPTFVTIGLTYSRALTDRIRAGVTAYLVSETLDRVSATGTAFDVGVQYHGLAGFRGLQLGVSLRHLGGNMRYDGPGLSRTANDGNSKRGDQLLKIESAGFSLPTSLEIGVAYNTVFSELHHLTLSGSFENNNYLLDQMRIGAEYSYKNIFFLRGSINLAPEDGNDVLGEATYLYGPAFGAGVNLDFDDLTLGVDYAFRTSGDVFDGGHAFSVKIGF